jgi:hypothetical protein
MYSYLIILQFATINHDVPRLTTNNDDVLQPTTTTNDVLQLATINDGILTCICGCASCDLAGSVEAAEPTSVKSTIHY